jgi:hypothetical protein
MPMLVFLILFLLGWKGQAQESCHSVFLKITTVDIAIDVSPSERFLNPKTPLLFSNWIHSINRQISQNVKIPQKIILNVSPYNFEPETKPEMAIIHIGERYANGTDKKIYFKDPSYSYAILTHEYAHILFFEKSKEVISLVKYFQKVNLKKDALIEEFKALHQEKVKILFQKSMDLDERSMSLISAREKVVDSQYHNLEARLKSLFETYSEATEIMDKYYRRKSPYDELFADIVAIMIMDDPQAISKALALNGKDQFEGTPKEVKSATQFKKIENKRRDFSTHMNRNELKEFYSPHGVFAEVRQFLWNEYLSRPEIRYRQKSLFISKALDSILNEIQWTIDEFEDLGYSDFPMINQHLIQRMRQDLSEFAPQNGNSAFSGSE